MPIYEYKCKECGYQLEKLQKIADKPLRICPACKKPHLVKLISSTSFQLKGTGWYVTDFKNSAEKKTKISGDQTDKKKEAKPPEKQKDTEKK